MNLCKLKNCGLSVHARSLCSKHYRRLQRNNFKHTIVSITKDTDLTDLEKFHKLYFTDQVHKCWKWNKSLNSSGYGRIMIKGKRMGAHVWSYILNKGEIPLGKLVCHTCDVRNCVNPNHLFVGTKLDNNMDKINKGRDGQNCLKPEVVSSIKRELEKNISINEISNLFNVNKQKIYRIKNNKNWAHVA